MTYGLGTTDRVEVKKIEKKKLKDEIFLPPSDYKRIIPQPEKKESLERLHHYKFFQILHPIPNS